MAMKPVEVEILMKDRLSGALDKAGRKVDEMKGKATAASSEMDKVAYRHSRAHGANGRIAQGRTKRLPEPRPE